MSHLEDYPRGFQDGMRAAITWLHNRADEMNDPHAKHCLTSAATNLGWAFSHERKLGRDAGLGTPRDLRRRAPALVRKET